MVLRDNDNHKKNKEIEDNDNFKIIEEIDNEIKSLCKNMLQKESQKRPNSDEILREIHKIQNNKYYSKYFKVCQPLKALSLPPKTIINPQQKRCKSNEKIKNTISENVEFEPLALDDNDDTLWFYQASPKCYNSLFCGKASSLNVSLSPIPAKDNISPSPQLNLTPAFNQVIGQKTPFVLSFIEENQDKDDDINTDSDSFEIFEPKNLFFNFSQ